MKKGFKMISITIYCMCWMMMTKAQTNIANSWNDIDAYIAQYMKDWNIPGMAVVVIKNDSVIIKKTVGHAAFNSNANIDVNTLFSIGSCTKAFTSTALLMLQDEKKLDIEKPVIDYYPGLSLQDSVLQNEITIKDILSHRTGLDRAEHIWYGAGYNRSEIMQRLKYIKKVAPLRNNFIYNNMMYTLAGVVIENVSGMKYEDFISKRLFAPLGMKHSFYELPKNEINVAMPHHFIDSGLQLLPMPLLKGCEPAGGIWTDIDDMSVWLKFILNKGRKDTTQLLSKKAARSLRTPVLFTGSAMREDETELKSYGLGFGFTAYKGSRVMYHTGVSGGYITHIALMPEENVGVVMLSNIETFTNGFIDNMFDRALGKEQTDWNSDVLKIVKQQQSEENAERKDAFLQIKNRKVVDNANMFAGKFTNESCRPIEIIAKDKNLLLVFNNKSYPLVHDKDDHFWTYDENSLGKMEVIFSLTDSMISGLRFTIMGEELLFQKIQG
ncbi:MAG: serine hydrolase domain-containing protein [Ferruginibacter sp.]